jgi:hypothetical protein
MAIKGFAWIVLLGCLVGTPALADAGGYPAMVGAWKGSSETVVLGDHEHHQAGTQEPRLSSLAFTLTVQGQDGRRFWGTVESAHFKESLLAVFRTDAVNLLGADSSGTIEGRLLGPDLLELCYAEAGATIVASCTLLSRQ